MNRLAEIIELYLLPHFAAPDAKLQNFKEDLFKLCSVHQVIARQVLESPGSFEQGQMWLAIAAMVHSYYFCPDRRENCGRQIWKRQEFISIRYPDLYWLMERYPEVRKKIEQLSRFHQRYDRQHIQLLSKPAIDRVRQFEAGNALFARIASNSIKARHVGLTRQGYERQIKKMDEGR